jgi:hypothetical protein
MQAVTSYDKDAVRPFNNYPVSFLASWCYSMNAKVEINNGRITGAEIKHRDYVHATDGRNMYK